MCRRDMVDVKNGYAKYVVSTTLEEPFEWNTAGDMRVIETPEVTHLRFRVVKDG